MLEKTTLFDVSEIQDALVQTTLDEVYDALKEKGYNPIDQLVGYIMTGDPSYITSYKDARKKIQSIERDVILEVVLKEFIEG